MARKMSKAPSHAWRVVVVWELPGGHRETEYLGPYWRRSDAQGRVSNLRRSNGYRRFVSGAVESAALGEWVAEEAHSTP